MRKQGWTMMAALLAAALWTGPPRAEMTVSPGVALEREEGLSQALRGRAAIALGVTRVDGFAPLATALEAGVQRSASPHAVLHGVLGKGFARTPLVVSSPSGPRRVALRSGPNPFRGGSEMGFDVPQAGPVDLRIYDLAGREVRSLISGRWFPAGSHTETWDGRQQNGQMISSGVYFARLRTAAGEICRRVVKL